VTHSFDVLVIGSGVAGLSAARRAQQLGGSVLVLEKAWDLPGFGNSRQSGAIFVAADAPPTTPPDVLYRRMMERTDGTARPDVVRAWADNVARALRFQVAEGAVYGTRGASDESPYRLQPPQPQALGRPWRGAGPDVFLTRLVDRVRVASGTVIAGARARRLLVEGGRVVGVEASTADGVQRFRARSVVMADGGFQANRELMARHVTTDYLLDGSPLDTGDCLQMALEFGARTASMDVFYGHCRHRDALHNPRLSPHPAPAAAIEASLAVDAHGRRIADEAAGTTVMAVAIARSTTPGDCWLVLDDITWTGTAARGARRNVAELPLNPVLEQEGATVVVADSIEELAVRIPAPMEALAVTVTIYNRAVERRAGHELTPPRTGSPAPLARAPYRAIPLIAGVYFTMGGVLVNGRAQVLDERERPIPGLLAAGGTMAGLMGGPRAGYAGGWGEASTFGLLAGESAMAAARAEDAGD